MGISGLLKLLTSAQKPTHISSLRGKYVGVDAYDWLYRGAAKCDPELLSAQSTTKYVKFCMQRVKMLLRFGVRPYLVFDGGHHPMKAAIELSRKSEREASHAKGLELVREGKISEARKRFRNALDVTPTMAFELIKALRLSGVPYVVAPYEADAQLAYLEKQGIISAVITEDSDLPVFGCQNVIFKLDMSGNGMLFRLADLPKNGEFSFVGWTDALFRQWCILAGCDYLSSITGCGLIKGHRFLSKNKDIAQLIEALRAEGFKVLPNYEKLFREAEMTFLHQRVFCPLQQRLVHLTPLPDNLNNDIDVFAGSERRSLSDEVAVQIAQGLLDPISRKILGSFDKLALSAGVNLKPARSLYKFPKPRRR